MWNKMRRLYTILTCLSLVLVSCNDCIIDDMNPDYSVYLSASIEKALQTRTPYVPSDDVDTNADTPTDANPLLSAIWASTISDTFADGDNPGNQEGEYKVAYHTSANFKNGDKQRLRDIIYSQSGQSIYFVGMYPSTNWETLEEGKIAQYTFTGKEDVMFAHRVSGYYQAGGLSVIPNLLFHHLLTWLKFEIKAESEDVANMWGPISEIKIRSNDRVKIGFDYTESNWAEKIVFSGSTGDPRLNLYKKDTDEIFPGDSYVIPYSTTEEVAYVMCAPVVGANQEYDYYLEITTQHRTTTVPINLKSAQHTAFSGSTMGKQFTLSLLFKAGNNVAVSTVVTDWENGGVSSGTIE